MGIDNYVCDELPWAMRETLRASGQEELSLLGWCIGGTLVAMHAALEPGGAGAQPRPADHAGRHDRRAVRQLGGARLLRPRVRHRGAAVGARRRRRLGQQDDEAGHELLDDLPHAVAERAQGRGERARPTSRWRSGWPTTRPFPGRAYRQWITWMYKENRLVSGALRLRGRRVDLRRIDQNMLVVTAGADHIAPRPGTLPLLDLVSQRGRDAPRPPRRAHRPDGRLEGAQGDLAGHRGVARRALRSLEEETTNERNRDTGTPRGRHRPAQARGPRGAGHRRHARHRRRDLPQPRRPGRDRRRRLLVQQGGGREVISRRSRSRARPAASTRATSACTRTASAS